MRPTAPPPAVPAAALGRAPDGMEIDLRPAAPKPLSRLEIIARSKKADVPQRVQNGPTCGLYALGMVMDFWHAKDASAPTALVREEDTGGKGHRYNFEPTTGERILDYAKGAGFTLAGEMFSAEKLAATAAHFGYTAAIHEPDALDALYPILDAGHPAIVAFDVDYNGNPGDHGGLRAHYAIIEGYADIDGERYLIAKHGWGREKDHFWRAKDFDKAWRAMKETAFYHRALDGSKGDGTLPANVALPTSGETRHAIAESLAMKIVEIVPKGTDPTGGRIVAAPG